MIFVYIPFALLVLMGILNAVNLTDGFDGLAIVPTVISAASLSCNLRMRRVRRFGVQFASICGFHRCLAPKSWMVLAGALCGAGLGFLLVQRASGRSLLR